MTSDQTQGNGTELCQGRFQLDTKKRFFTRGWLGTGTASLGQPDNRVQGAFGHRSTTCCDS